VAAPVLPRRAWADVEDESVCDTPLGIPRVEEASQCDLLAPEGAAFPKLALVDLTDLASRSENMEAQLKNIDAAQAQLNREWALRVETAEVRVQEALDKVRLLQTSFETHSARIGNVFDKLSQMVQNISGRIAAVEKVPLCELSQRVKVVEALVQEAPEMMKEVRANVDQHVSGLTCAFDNMSTVTDRLSSRILDLERAAGEAACGVPGVPRVCFDEPVDPPPGRAPEDLLGCTVALCGLLSAPCLNGRPRAASQCVWTRRPSRRSRT